MTPEFRQAVYLFRHQPRLHGPAQDCIPLQLQLLFARLQLEYRSYQDTVALTRSFQWEGREGWEQCDVQEFCRVLFDAIELSVKHTPEMKDLIGDLFSGEVRSGVECQTCGLHSYAREPFLDLSLCIDDPEVRTVDDALKAYFQPELLCHDNCYMCQSCGRKTEAVRTQSLLKSPYILFLHLKRFTLDHRTLTRCKINKEVQFPFVLDLSMYMQRETTGESNQQAQDQMYELYSVLVHSGSAMGGHYCAYVLGFEERKWYLFNDSEVREAAEVEVMKTFGDSLNSNAQLYTGSSAYVLCYRRISPSNLQDVTAVPAHILSALEEIQPVVRSTEPSGALLKVQVHYHHQMVTLELPEDESLNRLLDIAKVTYGLEGVQDRDIRLCRFDMETGYELDTFQPTDQRPLHSLHLGNLQVLQIQVKHPGAQFDEADTLPLLIYSWNEACWESEKPISEKSTPTRFLVLRNCLIADLLFRIAADTGIPIELLCVLTAQREFLSSPNYHLATVSEVLKANTALYIEMLPESNAESQWERELERENHRIVVNFTSDHLQIRSKVMADDRISVAELADIIAKQENIDMTDYCIRLDSEEIVDMGSSLQRLSANRRELSVEIDPKPPSDRINLNFVIAELVSEGEHCYSFTPICKLAVPEQATCLSVQQALLPKLPFAGLRAEQLLLRPKIGQRLGRPLQQHDTFKMCKIYEQRNFAIQLFESSAPVLADEEVLIVAKVLESGRFVSVQELPVLQHISLEDFGVLLALQTGLDREKLEVTKGGVEMSASEARNERWVQLDGRIFQLLSESPWFVGPDGAIFLYCLCSVREEKEDLKTEEESKGNNRSQEKALKIVVRPLD